MDYFSSKIKYIVRLVLFVSFALFLITTSSAYADDVVIDGRVAGCGDGVVETGESCDVNNLNAQTCTTVGFSGGSLACTSACAFDTSACTVSSGGGGGGGGGSQTSSARSYVALEGLAMPFGVVSLLVDGVLVSTTTTNQLGQFSFTARNLAKGTYQFDLYATDKNKIRTATYSIQSEVARRSVLKLDNIVLGPSLHAELIEITKGNLLTFTGYAIPTSLVTLTFRDRKGQVTFYTATSSTDGAYVIPINTSAHAKDKYSAVTRVSWFTFTSSPSHTVWVTVGDTDKKRSAVDAQCPAKGDLNADCRVNLTDFSILLFWYLGTNLSDFATTEQIKLSNDGKVNLVDFSIILFNWTG